LAERIGTESYLIDAADDINPAWLTGKKTIGITPVRPRRKTW
jgi:4-hydroxy-3-methylbut-2-enyl diphosphate reductase